MAEASTDPTHPTGNFHADYDAATIYVDPKSLNDQIQILRKHCMDVADSVKTIQQTFADLKLGWAGTTHSEAEDFANHWETVMVALFGDKKDPQKGVLNVLLTGLLMVRANFGGTDEGLTHYFKKFGDALAGGGDSSPYQPAPSSPPPSVTDLTLSPVTETY